MNKAVIMTNEEFERLIKSIINYRNLEGKYIVEYASKLKKEFNRILSDNNVNGIVLIRKNTEALLMDNPDSFLDYLLIKY